MIILITVYLLNELVITNLHYMFKVLHNQFIRLFVHWCRLAMFFIYSCVVLLLVIRKSVKFSFSNQSFGQDLLALYLVQKKTLIKQVVAISIC